ncbi:SMI1/KNR4 family protein [Fulvivirga sediminis]|uniref:SMI1/KNR4 family protein n=1 Tax=Fulvivirga sediminis TaxID=2803949 RepID=A0A937K220_9BACT|nr:SMI1/KNR4 family protein [Fulvivirga sediminis]MBL3657910.1 SMI1/KNR4 family protein [Fulvivirga sediminis]
MNDYILDYKEELKGLQWDNVNFADLPVDNFAAIEAPEDIDNDFTFKDNLLEVIREAVGKEVITLLLITPDNLEVGDYYGFGYLENRTILPFKIVKNSVFLEWADLVIAGDDPEDVNKAWLYSFSANGISRSPLDIRINHALITDTGASLIDKSPNVFNKEALEKEKADFIAPYVKPVSTHYSMEEMAQAFNDVVTAEGLSIIPPKDNQEIYDEFEKLSGYPIPKILKDFFTLHNGVEKSAFLSAEEMLKQWKEWKWIYDDWTQEELYDEYEEVDKVLPLYTTPYWIPFFDLVGGNYVALDMAPHQDGTSGQIISFGADYQTGVYESTDLVAFLKSLNSRED